MAGTVSYTSKTLALTGGRKVYVLTVDWVGDAANGSVPATSLGLICGYCVKVIVNPGSTAPTASYAVQLQDAEDSTADALAGTVAALSATVTSTIYPGTANALTPPFFCGTYNYAMSGNSVNSANGRVIFFFVEELY